MDRILVVGMGKVGSLVAKLLRETGFEVEGLDAAERAGLPFPVHVGDVTDEGTLAKRLAGFDAVVSCLPYRLTGRVARAAHAARVHYFDPTEDVPTTREIRALAATSGRVMAPQCGLAPGFIGIVGAWLARGFDAVRGLHLRVGALPRHPTGLLGYAFNWSPEGVVNEYLNDCEVIRDGRRMTVPSMGDFEAIVIDGVRLEAFSTSGGLGTMCETYEGRVENLDYKTLRYPGHGELMRFFFHELRMKRRRDEAGAILVDAKPPVSEDVVYVHASVEGQKEGRLQREEFVRAYYPTEIAGGRWRAISWTTASSICAVIELVASGRLPSEGFVKQEDVALEDFLATRNGSLYRSPG